MKLIVAINNNGYIGKNGSMLWKSSEDFKHFRKLTTGKGEGNILLVGKTTFENDLKGKPLPNRDILVIGTGYNTLPGAVRRAYQKEQAANEMNKSVDIWVIGGASIYTNLIHICSEIHMSIIDDNSIGDVSFVVPDSYRGDIITYNFEPNKPII